VRRIDPEAGVDPLGLPIAADGCLVRSEIMSDAG
jgi:hypothetical protein